MLPVEEGVSAPCGGGCLCSLWMRVSLLSVDSLQADVSDLPKISHCNTGFEYEYISNSRDSSVQSSTPEPMRSTVNSLCVSLSRRFFNLLNRYKFESQVNSS